MIRKRKTKTKKIKTLNNNSKMSFTEALKYLDIEDYEERIFNSNSHGELFHIYDYIVIAELIKDKEEKGIKDGEGNSYKDTFRKWFIGLVEWAERNWSRPESIFQHITKLLYKTE